MPNNDMHLHFSKVNEQFLKLFCLKYSINPQHKPTAPQPDQRITDCPEGFIAVYTKHFEFSNLRIPFSFFFMDFLRQYRLNISQLTPTGAIKVSHFEIACRALGGEPSLPLFRQFFRLSRYGDWYSVDKRMSSGCVSRLPKKLTHWKDYFFWVSADVMSFKLPWRQPGEPLNVFYHDSEDFDKDMCRLLVENPTPPRPLKEHVLIMAGLSRNWPYANAEPILKDGDKEMSLLKYIQGKGVGVVRRTWRFLRENEDNILDRMKGICYDGWRGQGPSSVKSDIQGDVNTGGGDVKVPSQKTSEPERMPDLVFGSGTKLEPLVAPCMTSSSKRRKLVAVVSGEKSRSPEKDGVKQPDVTLETPVSDNRSAKRGGTKIVFSESSESSDEHVLESDVCVLDKVGRLAQLIGSVPELVTRYENKAKRESHLRNQISRYRLRVTLQDAKNAKLAKKVRKLKKRMMEHAKVVEILKKEMEDARAEGEEKLKQAHEELQIEKERVEKLKQVHELEAEGWRQERVSIKESLDRVSSERRWLIEEGFGYVINRLHKSQEYNKLLGAVQTHIWESGAHYGLVKCYESCKKGVALEDVSVYKPDAHKEFLKAVHDLEHTRFPYVEVLSQCTDCSLDDLKALEPIGLEKGEDEVVAGGDQ